MPEARLPRLLDAVIAIGSDLSLPVVLRRIVESACSLVDARFGALGVLGPASGDLAAGLSEFITVGADAEIIRAIGHYPQGHGILGLLISDPRPVRLHDIMSDPRAYGFPANHPPMHSFLGVPLRVRGEVFGNLYLTEKEGGGDFNEADEQLVVALAGAAAVAIENARLTDRLREVAILSDRERIARDLHDTVIQRLFATGMALQGAARLAQRPDVQARIQQAVDDLDDTIREIRGAIFALNAHERGERRLRVQALALAAELTPALGFEPRLHFDGPVDTVLDDHQGEQLLTIIREGLTNVAKHADATAADVYLRAGERLLLRVVDNGRGFDPDAPRGNGLANMEARAGNLGGVFSVRGGEQGGTVLEWDVPYRQQAGQTD